MSKKNREQRPNKPVAFTQPVKFQPDTKPLAGTPFEHLTPEELAVATVAIRHPKAEVQEPAVTLPAEVETVSIDVDIQAEPTPPQDAPAPVAAPLTLRERALAAGAIVEAAMARFGHRYPFRLVERPRGDDITFGTPGAPARLVEMVRRDMAVAMPGVMVEGKRRHQPTH